MIFDKEYHRLWRQKHSDRCKQYKKTYASKSNNRDKINKRQREYRANHRAEFKKYRLRYEKKHPNVVKAWHKRHKGKWEARNPEKLKAMQMRSAIKSREKRRVRESLWRKKHPDIVKERWRLWAQKNPEKTRLSEISGTQRHRSRKLNNPGFENFSLAEILKRDGYKCHLCGGRVRKSELSFDHIIPLAHGGPHARKNVAVAHLRCNVKRGAGRIAAQLRLM